MNTAKELATTQLFEGLPEDDLAAFAGIASEAKFEPEQVGMKQLCLRVIYSACTHVLQKASAGR